LSGSPKLLTCPIRGPLSVAELASDGLTLTEEARRIELIDMLLDRGYPKANIAVEVIVIKHVGEKGKNNVRADLVVYDQPLADISSMSFDGRLSHVLLVAEVKRDAKSKNRVFHTN